MNLRGMKVGAAAAGTVVLGAGALVLSASAAAVADPELRGATAVHLRTAMHGEATGYATYLAYAAEAEAAGHDDVADTFREIAGTELGHFTSQAAMVGHFRGELATVEMTVGHELAAVGRYGRWIRDADRADCAAAVDAFRDIQSTKATHLAAFAAAVEALVGPDEDMPELTVTGPAVVEPAEAVCDRSTGRDLHVAMSREALAGASYHVYAQSLRDERPELAELYATAAATDVQTHFARLAGLAGTVRETAANLRTAIADEMMDIRRYTAFQRAAARAGDRDAARLFGQFRADEEGHRTALAEALAGLEEPAEPTPTPTLPPTPTDPSPTPDEPTPTEPEPTPTEPTEPEPTEPEPTEPEPTEPPTEPEPTPTDAGSPYPGQAR